MFVPARTVAGPTLVIAKSADAPVTAVVVVAVLLPGVGSDVPLDTVAVLVNVEPLARVALVCATRIRVAEEPAARLAHEAVDVLPPDSVAPGPVDCVKLTKVSPAGNVSVMVALVAAFGPLFATVMV